MSVEIQPEAERFLIHIGEEIFKTAGHTAFSEFRDAVRDIIGVESSTKMANYVASTIREALEARQKTAEYTVGNKFFDHKWVSPLLTQPLIKSFQGFDNAVTYASTGQHGKAIGSAAGGIGNGGMAYATLSGAGGLGRGLFAGGRALLARSAALAAKKGAGTAVTSGAQLSQVPRAAAEMGISGVKGLNPVAVGQSLVKGAPGIARYAGFAASSSALGPDSPIMRDRAMIGKTVDGRKFNTSFKGTALMKRLRAK